MSNPTIFFKKVSESVREFLEKSKPGDLPKV